MDSVPWSGLVEAPYMSLTCSGATLKGMLHSSLFSMASVCIHHSTCSCRIMLQRRVCGPTIQLAYLNQYLPFISYSNPPPPLHLHTQPKTLSATLPPTGYLTTTLQRFCMGLTTSRCSSKHGTSSRRLWNRG